MEYDWMTEETSIDFCLNTAACNIRPLNGNDLNKEVCFHFNKGERTYIYVRDDMYQDEHAVVDSMVDWELDYAKLNKKRAKAPVAKRAPKAVVAKRAPKAVVAKKVPGASKPCPPGKERNPATGRCKKLDGASAAPTQKKPKDKPAKPKDKPAKPKDKPAKPKDKPAKPECPPGKVRNPATGRCKKQ